MFVSLVVFMSQNPDSDTRASQVNTYNPIYQTSDSENSKSRLEEPGGADWRLILKDIQEKRKIEEEQKKHQGVTVGEDEDVSIVAQQKAAQQQALEKQNAKTGDKSKAGKKRGGANNGISSTALRRRRKQSETAYNQKFGRFRREYTPDRAFYHEYPDSNRFESDETWRPPEMFSENSLIRRSAKPPTIEVMNSGLSAKKAGQQQPQLQDQQGLRKVVSQSKAEYIQQNLPQDYAKNTERIFLLLKTGYTVQWERIPMHLLTTLTKFPNFGIYSDAASSIGGYEIMDILADLPEAVLASPQLDLYVQQQKQRRAHVELNVRASTKQINGQAWIMDKFKNLPMLQHAWKTSPDQDWYFLIDDDTFVLADNLGRWLSTLDPSKPYYLGSAVAGLNYIFAYGGSGIVLSRGLMKLAFGDPSTDQWMEEYADRALQECCGDFLLAAFLKEKLNIDLNLAVSGKRFQGEPVNKVACTKQNWCTDIITFHHSSPRDMELLWEYERIRGYYAANLGDSYVFSPADGPVSHERPPITYSDIYTDFVKPYLKPMRSNWDNSAKEYQYSWSSEYMAGHATVEDYLRNDGFSDKPYTSVDQCRKACIANEQCLMFRYDPFQKYCGYSTSISLGHPAPFTVPQHGDNEVAQLLLKNGIESPRTQNQGVYSEWRFDRIEAMRAKCPCDPEGQRDIPDVDDTKEGWYWHARDKFEGRKDKEQQ